MKEPLLYLVGCVRGAGCRVLRDEAKKKGHPIFRGALKGCWVLPSGPTVRFGRGYALVFKLVLRVRP